MLSLISLTLSTFAQEGYEKQLKALADQLALKIKPTNKKRVAVASFVDLQGNITELGKSLAEEYAVYLTDNQLEVVERGQVDKLLKENKLPQTGLLDINQAATLGKVSGIQIIITGTVTPLDKSVKMILKAIDLEKAVQIGGSIGTIPRTQSIDALIRTVVAKEDNIFNESAKGNSTTPTTKATVSGDFEVDLTDDKCRNRNKTFGIYCFRNLFNEPILMNGYKYGGFSTSEVGKEKTNILIDSGAEECSSLIELQGFPFKQYTFYFHTVGNKEKEGFITLTVSSCKEKHLALTPKNFHLAIPKTK